MVKMKQHHPIGPRPRPPLAALALAALLLLTLHVDKAATSSSWKDEAIRFLNGSSFSCVHMATSTPDGFFRVRDGNHDLQQAMDALPYDQQLALNASAITGMSVDTLEALRAAAAAEGSYYNISYFFHPMPNFADISALSYILSKYDCVVSAVAITAPRAAAMDFQMPHMPFGFQLMTTVAVTTTPTVMDRVTACLKPFTPSLWLTILGLMLLSGVLVAIFEGGWGYNADFIWWQAREAKMSTRGQTDRTQLPRSSRVMDQADRFGYSFYRAFTALATGNAIDPQSAAGRVYNGGLCMCFVIIVASYTANLAAQLTTSGLPVQRVTGVDSFASIGSPCCIRNTSTHIEYAKRYFPTMPIYIIPGQTEQLLADYVLAGVCAGAMSSSANLLYLLASNSTYGCSLQLVGSPLNFAYFAIPWTRDPKPQVTNQSSGNHSVTDAMNLWMGELIDSGTLNQLHDDNFAPPAGAAVCPSASSSNGGAGSLDVQDLAGIFIIQALVAMVSLLLFAVLKLRSRHVRTQLKGTRMLASAASIGRRLRSKLRSTARLKSDLGSGYTQAFRPEALTVNGNGSGGLTGPRPEAAATHAVVHDNPTFSRAAEAD